MSRFSSRTRLTNLVRQPMLEGRSCEEEEGGREGGRVKVDHKSW